MKTIHHVLDADASRGKVYEALTTEDGLAGWGSTKVSAPGPEVGGVVEFRFVPDEFNPRMEMYYLESLRLLCEEGEGKPFQAG